MIKAVFKNKKVIFITGDRKKEAVHFIEFVLKDSFSLFHINRIPGIFDILHILKSDIIIIEDEGFDNPETIKSFLYPIKFCVFIVTGVKKRTRVKKFFRGFLKNWIPVLDFSVAKKLKKEKTKEVLTFGINKKSAQVYISDIYQKKEETNFKVNYKANIIPFWIKGKIKEKKIYGVLPALCVAKILNLNLAEVSYKIKEELFFFTKQ